MSGHTNDAVSCGWKNDVLTIRQILGESPGKRTTCTHDGAIRPGMPTCADCGTEVTDDAA